MFNYQRIEKKWQKIWEEKGIYKSKDNKKNKKNFYELVMFPYPSGNLHIGHWYNFAPADVFARFKKMSGYNVMMPIGFDAFGLPAENAAIKRSISPDVWTYGNIKTMAVQLKGIGAMYDWSREIITADPEYYKWTQWIFLQLYKNGLAYKKKAPANWCPKCHTVLANEQVVNGYCDRCQTEVVQRDIEQWLFKITDYADRLLKDLERINWPEKTKIMQRNWIGKSEGATIKFSIVITSEAKQSSNNNIIEVFTTRLDTVFGCTYLVVSPEHSLIENLKFKIENFNEVGKYIEQAKNKTDLQRTDLAKNKTGVELKGIKAINPFNNEEAPIFIADYVLGSYGTGAVMAVPAHDERDWEFAKKYNLPIRESILGGDVSKGVFIEDGILINSGVFTGLTSGKAREEMINWLGKNKLGGKKNNYRLRDWLISRQRYWGTPIPIIYCDKCGIVPVPEKDLPVKLPKIKNYLPTEEGKSPLANSGKFVKVKCPKCGNYGERETDTMDTFVCSSWYYLRYVDPKNSKKFADSKKIKNWLPVDLYIGGAEHAVMHLLYARFFAKVLSDLKFIDFDEPFSKLVHQGIILGPDGQKMSKSRGNVVDPDDLVRKFGSDTVRMYLCFMGPYEQGGPWQPTGILGIERFLQRIYKQIQNVKIRNKNDKLKFKNDKLEKLLHQTIKKITEDIENFRFNTAISGLMVLFNGMEKEKTFPLIFYSKFLILLSPFAPHLSEELWQQLKTENSKLKTFKSIFEESWPKYDSKLIKEKEFELIIQINGKVRDKVLVSTGISQKEAEETALKRQKIKELLVSGKVKKIIFVPDRLINIVI